jgi:hypothetical protein
MIKLSPEEMAGRREDSQCFKCPEKWSQAHQKTCPMRGIYLLDVSEDEHPDDDSINSEVEISPPPPPRSHWCLHSRDHVATRLCPGSGSHHLD